MLLLLQATAQTFRDLRCPRESLKVIELVLLRISVSFLAKRTIPKPRSRLFDNKATMAQPGCADEDCSRAQMRLRDSTENVVVVSSFLPSRLTTSAFLDEAPETERDRLHGESGKLKIGANQKEETKSLTPICNTSGLSR
jgi:hypothetical protein